MGRLDRQFKGEGERHCRHDRGVERSLRRSARPAQAGARRQLRDARDVQVLAAFSIFFMGSPSFLGHQQALAEGHGRSNCETLFGISAIPSDNYIRLMLDGASPAAFDGLFVEGDRGSGATDTVPVS